MGKDLKGKELGEGLCQIKDGRYLGRYTDVYGKRHNIYGRKLKEVKEKLNKAVYENKIGLGDVSNSSKITFDELYQMWFNYKLTTIKTSTCAMYKAYYESNIKAFLGLKKITEIKKEDIEKIFISLAQRSICASTAHTIKIIIHNIFEFAVDKKLLLINPCQRIKIPKALLKENTERLALTVEQQKQFIEFGEKNNYKFLPLFKLMLLTGMRIGEVLALTWDDVDLKNKKIKINKTFANTRKLNSDNWNSIQSPKTRNSRRDIPMCDLAIKLLLVQKESDLTCNEWVFTSLKGKPIIYSTIESSLKNFINKINKYEKQQAILENRDFVQFPNITLHSFRHTFATRCFENGIPPKVVQKYLGHSTLAMTMDLYTHVEDKLLEENISKIDNTF